MTFLKAIHQGPMKFLQNRNKTRDDQKIYQAKVLPNGLKVLIVSDSKKSEPKKSVASMAVKVGVFADPPDLQGLAHLLEHLLFMGTSKYPEENAFDDYLLKNGGSMNAETQMDKTVYKTCWTI